MMRALLLIGLVACAAGCEFECGRFYATGLTVDTGASTVGDGGPNEGDGGLDAQVREAGTPPEVDGAGPPLDASPPLRPCLTGFAAMKRSPLSVKELTPQWVVNAGDGGVWFSSNTNAGDKLGRVLPSVTAEPEPARIGDGTPTGLAADRTGRIWVGYDNDPRAVQTLRLPKDPYDLRTIDPSSAPRTGLTVDERGRLWWLEETFVATPDAGTPVRTTQLAFTTPQPPGSGVATQTILPLTGAILNLLQASEGAVWYAGTLRGEVVLGRVDRAGKLDTARLQTPESGRLRGSSLDLVIDADQTAWLLASDETVQPVRYLLFSATDVAGVLTTSTPRVLAEGRAKAIAHYEPCGVLVSHDMPAGVSLVEPDGGTHELALPAEFQAAAGVPPRQQGRLVAVLDGMALLELSPPGIVILRQATTSP